MEVELFFPFGLLLGILGATNCPRHTTFEPEHGTVDRCTERAFPNVKIKIIKN